MILYTERFNLDDKATAHETSFLDAVKQLLAKQSSQTIALQLPTTDHPQLDAIAEYLANHLEDKLKTGDVATHFGMSERTMSRLFQKEFNMPFVQYFKLLRMVHAVEMLVLPGKNVSDVAYAVGYESLSTFSNNFNEVMGIRPNLFLQN
jgi:transcriptional regulator GlxA family with amidase domain